MDARLRQLVRERAADRCEYCRLPQAVLRTTLQIEHIVARQHMGEDAAENLALSCDRCNLHKGPNLAGIDPDSGELTRLFDPRRDAWDQHFELSREVIVGAVRSAERPFNCSNSTPRLACGCVPP